MFLMPYRTLHRLLGPSTSFVHVWFGCRKNIMSIRFLVETTVSEEFFAALKKSLTFLFLGYPTQMINVDLHPIQKLRWAD